MVFYFSGTGNSQLAAKQIAAELGDELVFINDCLKKGEKKHITMSIINAILLILNIICYIKKGKQETAHA